MSYQLKRVAVLGAGTMGSQIAAHFANVGIPTLLLDLRSEGPDPSAIARGALKKMLKMRPAPFFLPDHAQLIEIGNFEDDLPRLREVDWIIEAIAERLDWKRELWQKVAPHRRENTIVSSNTSGIPLAQISEGFDESFRSHWLGTHFFNPPRYMKLLEIIPDSDTLPAVVEYVAKTGDRLLGKGVVLAKDRPNFIANRIGTYAAARAMCLRAEMGLSIEEVDVLTGPAIGRPKTGTYKLGDLVGNDVMMFVGQNLHDNLPGDPQRTEFLPDELMKSLVERGATGRKAGAGFYKKEGREILVIDPETMEYRPQQPPQIPSLALIRDEPSPIARITTLLESGDRAAQFLWPLLRDTFAYAAGRIPEISDYVYSVDRALRWGFAWDLGAFEVWDGLGVASVVQKSRQEGIEFPGWIDDVLARPEQSFYTWREQTYYFDLGRKEYLPVPSQPEKIELPEVRKSRGVVLSNQDASLIDLGDGVACLEFHSKMNSLTPGIVEFSQLALAEIDKSFCAMVIGNQASDFSVGANLVFLLEAASRGLWKEVHEAVGAFQQMTSSFRHSPRPVVAAPFGRTLAGGAEVCLGCDAVVAASETYMGLVEVGVGLIPAGGGTKELLVRNIAQFGSDPKADRMAGVKRAFQAIGTAQVSTSAEEARAMRFLNAGDAIEINGDRLLHHAKQKALSLVTAGYTPPQPRNDIPVEGAAGLAVLKVGLHLMQQSGFISEHDKLIGTKLSYILTGGDLNHSTQVSEQYLLELERDAFVSLCGEEKTRQRIEHMLKTGKPLRN